LSDRPAFAKHLAPTRQTEWVVYAKPLFAGPQQVLDYVGRYTHRVAIANQRLLDLHDGHVRFRYKDYRAAPWQTDTTMTLPATEFIRRFLLHVLPARFNRIRYDGLLGNRVRRERVGQCRRLLNLPPPVTATPEVGPADYRDRYEALTGSSLRTCPRCHDGRMLTVEHLAGIRRVSPLIDTS
jgi:hypothetical protein